MLLALLGAIVISQSLLVSQLRQLPSEIFGGDLYYQMGCASSIRDSGNPMASCSVSDALPGYLPLYGTLVALVSRFTGLDVLPAMLWMSVLLKALAGLALYALVAEVSGPPAGVLVAALAYASKPALIAHYTEFSAQIVVPIFLLSLLRFLRVRTTRSALVLGGILGLAGYSHAVVFIGSVWIFLIAGVLALAAEARATGPAETLRREWRPFGLVCLGSLLALGYWYRPIFVHHGHTSAHYTEIGGPTLATLGDRLALAGRFLRSQADFSSLLSTTLTILPAFGFAWAIRRRREPATRSALLVAGVTFAYVFHYFVTQPLLGMNFVPGYAGWMLWGEARWLLVAMPLATLLALPRPRLLRAALLAVSLVVTLGLATVQMQLLALQQPYVVARTPLVLMFTALQEFVRGNTGVNDVFLSSNELSFALSALTGRKVMVTRRAQNDPFVDMDARNRDAALILYGNDPAQGRELLRRYRVRYLLWAAPWVQTEYRLAPDGRSLYHLDPLLYFENPDYDAELSRAGVSVTHVENWVDPALRLPEIRQFRLSLVAPTNYRSGVTPWRAGLDSLLEPVWTYRDSSQVAIAALYRVKL